MSDFFDVQKRIGEDISFDDLVEFSAGDEVASSAIRDASSEGTATQGYDYSSFFDPSISPLERLNVIQKGVEYVMAEKSRKDNFMCFSQQAKKAFDVCIGHDEIDDSEVEHLHYFLCLRCLYGRSIYPYCKGKKKLVSNKSKYTDWTNRQDVKDELYADVEKLLKKNGYPPKTIDDAYDEIMKQVENYKKYASMASASRKKTVDYIMTDGTVVEV